MKTVIFVLLYAVASVAGTQVFDCIATPDFLLPKCNQSGLVPTIAVSVGASATATGLYLRPTTGPTDDRNFFTFPGGAVEHNAKGDLDVTWKKDATNCSIQLNCTVTATGRNVTKVVKLQEQDERDSKLTLPDESAICILGLLDAKGNSITVSPEFEVPGAGDADQKWSTSGTSPAVSSTSTIATSLSSTLTNAAKSTATSVASSSISLSTSSSSPLPSTAPSATVPSSKGSTVFTTIVEKTDSSGSQPSARVQTVIGILAGAVALALFHSSS